MAPESSRKAEAQTTTHLNLSQERLKSQNRRPLRHWPTARSPKQRIKAVDAKDAFSATAEKKNDEEAPPQRRNSKRPAKKSSDRRYIGRLFDPTLAAPPSRRRPQDKPEGRPSPIRPPPKFDETLVRQVLAVPHATTIFTVEDLTTIRIARSFAVLVTEVCSSVTNIDFEFKFKYT
ncbi:hypothetical protein QR680_018530 [Steinernema hermaphroditum]|uniref:Uncharacterized protein n=1 Tax=Steinernema hermaphroditum TaxID=289476 RepID=A0AA39HKC1_9BILA|nr:hypothetical protein QR680_018530 [Steinernema hermaphroditum]